MATRERRSRDTELEQQALELQQQQIDQQNMVGMMNMLQQLYGIQQQSQMDPARLEAMQLQNMAAEYNIEDFLTMAPERRRAVILANQATEDTNTRANTRAPLENKVLESQGVSIDLDNLFKPQIQQQTLDTGRLQNVGLDLQNQASTMKLDAMPTQLQQEIDLGGLKIRGLDLANQGTAVSNSLIPKIANAEIYRNLAAGDATLFPQGVPDAARDERIRGRDPAPRMIREDEAFVKRQKEQQRRDRWVQREALIKQAEERDKNKRPWWQYANPMYQPFN